MDNHTMKLIVGCDPCNEGFARAVVAGFAARRDPTMDVLSDVQTIVSEAVTNCIIHAYPQGRGEIELTATLEGNLLTVEVRDWGCGIADVRKAMEPFYTGRPDEERAGIGFAVMRSLSDELTVLSAPGKGTLIRAKKTVAGQQGEQTHADQQA